MPKMLSFENYANCCKPSGLNEREQTDSDDDGEMKPMIDDNEIPYQPIPSSDQSMLVFNHDQAVYHFDKRFLTKIPPIASSVMAAYAKSEGEKMVDLRNRAVACACLQPCLPAIIPSSPLLSLLENTSPNIPIVPRQMYNSFCFNAYQLLEYKVAICDDVLPCDLLREETKKSYIEQYSRHMEQNGIELDRELDLLFAREAEPSLQEFTALVEGFCITYINELERFLFKCLVEPYGSDVQLAHVLTPRIFVTLKQVPFDKREQIVQDVVRFFDYKQKEQQMFTITAETIMQEVKQEGSELYKSYVPVRTLRQYMSVMNIYDEDANA